MKTFLPFALFGVALVHAAPASAQGTLHVPGDFPTIQQALNVAAPGSTILVGPGVWDTGPLGFPAKAVTLRSAQGPDATILDGNNSYRILQVASGTPATARIEGFTFYRGTGPGGAISMNGDASPTIVDCVFRGNRAGNGFAGSTGSQGIDATSNGATGGTGGTGGTGSDGGNGGAIRVGVGTPRISNSIFYDNFAGNGGTGGTGGRGGKGGSWGLFTDPGKGGTGGWGGPGGNAGRGGAIAVDGGHVELIGCFFRLNGAGAGGAGGAGGQGGPGGNAAPLGSPGPSGTGGDGRSGQNGGYGGTLAVLTAGGGFTIVNCTFRDALHGNGGSGGLGGSGWPNGSNGSVGFAGMGSVAWSSFGSGLSIANSLLAGNAGGSSAVSWQSGAQPSITTTVSNGGAYTGVGNIHAVVAFAPHAQAWQQFRPVAGSVTIDAGDGSALSAVHAKTIGGFPRRIDDPSVVNGPLAGAPAIDIGAAEYLPPAQLTAYDCPLNPPTSLVHVSGSATPGTVLSLAVDNPSGSQAFAVALGLIAFGSYASDVNPCGLPLAGFGMGGPGALGGLAIDLAPGASLPEQVLGLWAGAPVPWNLGLPNLPGLHGLPLTLQGLLFDTTGGPVTFALTRALRVVIGA